MPVEPAARGPVSGAPGHAAVGAVVVEPLEVGIEPVVDIADPLGRHRAVALPGSRREPCGFGPLLGVGVQGGREAGERGQAAVHPLPVDGDEELFGNGQATEVGGQHHGVGALRGPGPRRWRRG